MSKTEGLWGGKLFKIKLDEEEKIIGREKKIENGWDGQNKYKSKVVVKIGDENNKKEVNNDKVVKDECESEIGGGMREASREVGV